MVAPGLQRPVLASVESSTLVEPMSEAGEETTPVMSGADNVSQGIASVEVDGAGPQLGDGIGELVAGFGEARHLHQCSRECCPERRGPSAWVLKHQESRGV
jgi:hypothetical protein